MTSVQIRRLALWSLVPLLAVLSGCGVVFGSQGEADRSEAALRLTPESDSAPGAPAAPAGPASAPAPASNDSPITFPSVPLAPEGVVDQPPADQPVDGVPTSINRAMTAERVSYCTEVAGVLSYATESFGGTGLPRRDDFLALVEHIRIRIDRAIVLDRRPEATGHRMAVEAAAIGLATAPDDEAFVGAVTSAANVFSTYLVDAYAECVFEATGREERRDVMTMTPEIVRLILQN